MNNIINIKRISPILLVLVALFSCEEKFQVLDSSSYFVRFGQSTVDVLEGNSVIKIPVTLAGPKQGSPVTISYEVSGTAVKAQDFSFASTEGSLSIPAGSFSDTIRINVLDDFNTDGLKTVVLNLKTASNGLKVGLGTLGNKLTVNIADNDCPFDIANYVGAYSLTMTLANGFIFAAGTYDLDATLTLGAGTNQLIDPDFGILSQSGRTAVPVTIQIDPTAATTRTLGGAYTFNTAESITDGVYAYGTAPNQRVFTGNGLGSLLSCTKSFTVKALIRRQDGSTGQILTLTYTKK